MGNEEIRVPVLIDADVVIARQKSRELASQLGFSKVDMTLVATAISEISRNIVTYTGNGEIILSIVHEGKRQGLRVIGQDKGPGIPDIDKAMQDGYSTAGSLGLGLQGAKRLMDDFEIVSEVGKGTIITMTKWTKAHGT